MLLTFELPTKHLKSLGAHTDINFALAHMVGNNAYTDYYHASDKYTILDNSNFELGYPLSPDKVIAAAKTLKAQEVIAPDVFGSGSKTIKATNDFIKYLQDSGNLGKYKVMAVVQGCNVPDWTICLRRFTENPHIDVLGFSYQGCKSFHQDLGNARIAAVRLATHPAGGNLKKPIHLLGMGNNPIELKCHKAVTNVRSCDTSLPVVQGISLNKLHPEKGLIGPKLSRPENFFGMELNPSQHEVIIHNIKTMKEWIR